MLVATRGHDDLKLVSKRFRKNYPLNFEGDIGPLMINEWIKNIEKILKYARILIENKIICTTYILQKRYPSLQ